MCKQVSYSPALRLDGAATQVQGPGGLAYQLKDLSPVPACDVISERRVRQHSWKSGVQMEGRTNPAATLEACWRALEACWRASRGALGYGSREKLCPTRKLPEKEHGRLLVAVVGLGSDRGLTSFTCS